VTPIDLTNLSDTIQEEARSYAVARRLMEGLYPLYDSILTAPPDGPLLASHMRSAQQALAAITEATQARGRLLDVMLSTTALDEEERAHMTFMVAFEEARSRTWYQQLTNNPVTLRLRLLRADPTPADAREVWEALGEVLLCWRQLQADYALYQGWVERIHAIVQEEPTELIPLAGPEALDEGQTLTLEEAYASMSEAELRAIRAFGDARAAYQTFKRRLNEMGEDPTCIEVSRVLQPGNKAVRLIADGYGALCWGAEVQRYVLNFPEKRRGDLLELSQSASETHSQLARIATNGVRLEERMERMGILPLSESDSREVLRLLLHVADLERRGREDRRRFQELSGQNGE